MNKFKDNQNLGFLIILIWFGVNMIMVLSGMYSKISWQLFVLFLSGYILGFTWS